MELVSAVMPTRGRCELAARAVQCFLAQTYENKELVVLDDFDCPSFPAGLDHPLIQYSQTENIRFNIPVKRNRANATARGTYIIHFDSDDWSDPERMGVQISRLKETGKSVTGYNELLFHEPATGKAYQYRINSEFACGSSLAYSRRFWESNRFPENRPIGSDNRFIGFARQVRQLDFVPGANLMVARIHKDNTSPKQNPGKQYFPIPFETLPAAYRALEMVPA